MAKKINQVAFYLSEEFLPEWDLFLKIIAKDPFITSIVSKNRANRKRRVSIALRELIKLYNNKHRQRILAEQKAEQEAEPEEAEAVQPA